MPQELLSNADQITVYLVSIFWIISALCGILVVVVLAFCALASRAMRRTGSVVPECYQFGAINNRKSKMARTHRPGFKPVTVR